MGRAKSRVVCTACNDEGVPNGAVGVRCTCGGGAVSAVVDSPVVRHEAGCAMTTECRACGRRLPWAYHDYS